MKRCLVLGGLLALVLSVGCSAYRPAYHIRQQYDEFEGHTKVDLIHNYLGGNKDYQIVQLNISEHVSSAGKATYALNLIYQANDWLGIKDGESLIMLVDGERLGLVVEDEPEEGVKGTSYRGARSSGGAFTIELAHYGGNESYYEPVGNRRYRRGPYYRYRPRQYGYRPYGYSYGYLPYRPNLYLYGAVPYVPLSPHRSPYGYGYSRPYGYGYSRPYDHRHGRFNGPVVYEKKTYPISFATLQRIAGAREVKIRVVGQFFVHRYFTDENFAIFQRFVDESAARYSEEGWTNL